MDIVKLGEVATVELSKYTVKELLEVKGETPVIGCSDNVKGFTGVEPTGRNGTITIWGGGILAMQVV